MDKPPTQTIVLVSILLSTIAAAFFPGWAPINLIVVMLLILGAPLWCDR